MTEENSSYSPQSVSGCLDYETCKSPIKNEASCRKGLTHLAYKSLGMCNNNEVIKYQNSKQ